MAPAEQAKPRTKSSKLSSKMGKEFVGDWFKRFTQNANDAFEERPASSEREKIRRLIVTTVFVIYWLLIFEGVLRKWALPGLHKILFFIRDPFVLAIYVLALKYRLWPKPSPLFVAGLGLAIAFLVLTLIQALPSPVGPMIYFYGWRNYFFYLPLAFIIGEQFRGKDLARLIRHTLIVSVGIAALCYQQFRAPPDAGINESYNGLTQQMLVSRGIVRTSGTFTVSASQNLYIGSLLAMLFSIWLMPRSQRPLNKIWLWLSSAATLTTFAVSGARSVFIIGAMIALAAFISVFITRRYQLSLKKVIIIPLVVLGGGIVYVTLFSEAFQAMVQRQIDANANEGSTLMRALGTFTTVLRIWPMLTMTGSGIGTGTNAAWMLNISQTYLAEDEIQRIILETGMFGVLYVAYRFWLTGWIIVNSVHASRRSHNPLPFILISYEALTLSYGQMTMQGTINGYGWLFAGFCIAANRLGLARKGPQATKADKENIWS
jgi:hypothetical protein